MKHIIAILCAALVFAGCSNMIDPPVHEKAGAKKGGLQINISNGEMNARTLFPKADITKYILSFVGPVSHADVTLSGGNTTATVNDLANGLWAITAIGYVTINGTEYEAAQGSAQVNVASGSFQSLDLTIRASMDGADGFFKYSVSLPPTKVMNSAVLRIYPYGSDQYSGENRDLKYAFSGTISLAPGYYMMTIGLENNYQSAGHAEIVYICSNMETQANYTFSDADFTDTITLSGTINVTFGGSPLSQVEISAIDQSGNSIGSISLYSPGANSPWSITIPSFDTATNVSFTVRSYGSLSFIKTVENLAQGITDQDRTNIAINLDPIANATTLAANTWKDGYIAIAGDNDFYTIDVNDGTTYYLWWNDRSSGDGSQSLDIYVAGYYSDGSYVFIADSAWHDPVSFTADSSGVIFLKVRGSTGTGSYQIVYSTGSTKPVF